MATGAEPAPEAKVANHKHDEPRDEIPTRERGRIGTLNALKRDEILMANFANFAAPHRAGQQSLDLAKKTGRTYDCTVSLKMSRLKKKKKQNCQRGPAPTTYAGPLAQFKLRMNNP